MKILRKLAFRVAAPILLLVTLFGLVLHLFVADMINFFARERAEEDLKSFSREIFGNCNRCFEELMQSGKLEDPTAVRIKKALTMGDVEDYLEKFRLKGIICQRNDSKSEILMETEEAQELRSAASSANNTNILISRSVAGKHYFAYTFDFQPWGWRILIARDSAAYSSLVERVQQLYWIFSALLFLMTFGLIIVENRLLSRPVNQIIRDLRDGVPPSYTGLVEFEFLSTSIAGMMRTLAEREARLRESENRYRTIFETTGTAIAVSEEDTTISMVNARFEQDTGYSKKEIEGKKCWTELVSEDDLEWMKEIHALRRTNPDAVPVQYEFKLTDKQGTCKHMLLTGGIITGTTQSIVSLIDITDRKREELERRLEREARSAEALRRKNVELAQEIDARKRTEESLRASEERFRVIFEAAEDCFFIKNTKLEYTHANPAYLKLLERPIEEVLGKTDDALALDSHYAERANSLEIRVLEGESFETEHTVTWKGWPISLDIIRFPLRDSSGNTFGICGIARDVSERKAAQDERLAPPSRSYRSAMIQETRRQVVLAAESDSTVLFLGESGTGKDHWARFLHDHSRRSGSSFFSINCAALPPELVESELFGHEAGAFTGARARKRGLLELAEGGTLLLNEIGEMPWALQSKLLTFMDTQSITRVGGETSITVDARILAATNRDLVKEIEKERFRLDLFYRLAVLTITVPPLRERMEDLPRLARELLSRAGERMGLTNLPSLDNAAMSALLDYNWPGNIRELQNVLERALILCDRKKITVMDLGLEKTDSKQPGASRDTEMAILLGRARSFDEAVEETKRALINKALERSRGSIKKAAILLGMTRNSIDHHMRRLGIRK
ncbi:sigma-54-dependent Fis family transcriptional regulator [Desulfomonile tiedjei]|uniref:PAS domain S-box n=1 Tax=Desulfomonile tiedjei (strain ATCC 49306 / DSM 6799 / DCB-1) TaxID=706587 RepID=I4C1U9_DESTA|nr:sigma-54-dependent Fis family transcriptional regulator [Desulfomonile tiedjei]AFM23540.1 PAS domain S-box [Desulfomonile tiedjei DSM 6799]